MNIAVERIHFFFLLIQKEERNVTRFKGPSEVRLATVSSHFEPILGIIADHTKIQFQSHPQQLIFIFNFQRRMEIEAVLRTAIAKLQAYSEINKIFGDGGRRSNKNEFIVSNLFVFLSRYFYYFF